MSPAPDVDIVAVIRDAWGWAGLEPEEVVGENDFGNLVFRDATGVYWRLTPEELRCEIVATTRAELDELAHDPSFREDWAMGALGEEARGHFGELPEGKKFCFVIPPPLGGGYELSNIRVVPLEELIGFSGDIARQIRDLPDGAQVELRVVD